MHERICGTEIEYGCLIEADDLARAISPESLSLVVKDHLFDRKDVGVLDVHHRPLLGCINSLIRHTVVHRVDFFFCSLYIRW